MALRGWGREAAHCIQDLPWRGPVARINAGVSPQNPARCAYQIGGGKGYGTLFGVCVVVQSPGADELLIGVGQDGERQFAAPAQRVVLSHALGRDGPKVGAGGPNLIIYAGQLHQLALAPRSPVAAVKDENDGVNGRSFWNGRSLWNGRCQ